jgi:hypothetical protein
LEMNFNIKGRSKFWLPHIYLTSGQKFLKILECVYVNR